MKVKFSKSTIDKILKKLTRGKIGGGEIKVGFLTGKIMESGTIIIEDVIVPKQNSTEVSTSIEPGEFTRASKNLNKREKAVVGFIAFNGPFPVFESAATKRYREKLVSQGVPNLGLVINAEGEYEIFCDDSVKS